MKQKITRANYRKTHNPLSLLSPSVVEGMIVQGFKSILCAPETALPHSPQWFEYLNEYTPLCAALTWVVLQKASHIEVCSVCGDEPAPIYEYLDGLRILIRLCDECRDIQTTDFGLRLKRWVNNFNWKGF